MSWVEVDGAGWSWVGVDEVGWRMMHGLVIRIKFQCKDSLNFSFKRLAIPVIYNFWFSFPIRWLYYRDNHVMKISL